MKDLGLIIRTKFYERLNGIAYSGGNLKVYDSASVPSSANPPYVTLGTFLSTEIGEGSKDSYGQECMLQLEVITKASNSYGGKALADEITNQIMELCRTRQSGYFDLSPNFQLISIVLENTQTIEDLVETGLISRRLIRFRLKVHEI
jgi:hypothetical protein